MISVSLLQVYRSTNVHDKKDSLRFFEIKVLAKKRF